MSRTNDTQERRIYKHLQTAGTITTLEAFQLYGITRLAARIHELRERGVEIHTERKSVKNRFGETASIAEYHLVLNQNRTR